MGDATSKSETDGELDAIVDEVIQAAGGDLREAILGLIRGQQEIAAENAKTVSAGYVRRNLPRS